MATSGYIESLLGSLPTETKRVLTEAFRYVVANGRFGPIDHQTKTESFQAYYVQSTTASTANDEFSVVHGLGRTPYLALSVMPLDSTGWQSVRLRVTRAADSQRVYLSSPDTNASITLLVE